MHTRPELAALQETFSHAVLRAGLLVPETVASMAGPSRERRLGVYRNNVKASLVAALVARFPVVQRLVGEEFFEAAAVVFVEHHPPRSPVLESMAQASLPSSKASNPPATCPISPISPASNGRASKPSTLPMRRRSASTVLQNSMPTLSFRLGSSCIRRPSWLPHRGPSRRSGRPTRLTKTSSESARTSRARSRWLPARIRTFSSACCRPAPI